MSSDERPQDPDERDSEEFEFESVESEDIEAAMQDALRAVEGVSPGSQAGEEDESISPAHSATATMGASESIDNEVERLRAEVADLRDRSARTLADFDNFRKRSDKERVEERRFAAADVLRSLLPVIDNLERALFAEGSEQDLKAGVELILRQIQEILTASGVERVAALGEVFDPKFHEAVSRHEDASIDTPMVSQELQSGYTMHDRLLRPAVVKVAMPAIDEEVEAETAEGE